MPEKNVRHVLGISGGKDSAALAVYMRDRVEGMEYFFCDTGKELPEAYEFLDRLEAYLGTPIARLNSGRGFDHWLKMYNNYLPSSRMRWCTRMLKIKPFEEFVGEDETVSYIGIRADEDRSGYVTTKTNITPVFPFKDDGITRADVIRILEDAGLGLPKYYEWRTRSGCYFCFFQRKMEWVGLKERHPELYESAKQYEKMVPDESQGVFTWSQGESLEALEQTERVEQIRERHEKELRRETTRLPNRRLIDVLEDVLDDEDDDKPCLMCHL